MRINDYISNLSKFIRNSLADQVVKDPMVKYLNVAILNDLSIAGLQNKYAEIEVDGQDDILPEYKVELIRAVGTDLGKCFELTSFTKILEAVGDHNASTELVKQTFEHLKCRPNVMYVNQLPLAAKLFILKYVPIVNREIELNGNAAKLLELTNGEALFEGDESTFIKSWDFILNTYFKYLNIWKENKKRVNDSAFSGLIWGHHIGESLSSDICIKFLPF
jgi:hypothetical protein